MKNTFKLTAVAMLVVATTGCNLFDTRTVYRDPDDSKLRQLNEQIQQAQTNLDKLKAEQQQAQKNLTAAKAALSQAQADKVAADKMLQAAKTATEKAQAEKLVAEKAAQVANAAKVKAEAEKVAAEKAAQEAKALADKAAADAKAAADKAKNSQSAQDKTAAAEKAKAEQEAAKKAAEAKKRAEELAKKNAEVEKKRTETQAYRENLETLNGAKWRVSYPSSGYDNNRWEGELVTDDYGRTSFAFYNSTKGSDSPTVDFSQYEINPNKVQNYDFSAKEIEHSKLNKIAFVNLRNATFYSTSAENPDNNKLVGRYIKESAKMLTQKYRDASEYLSAKPTATYNGKVLGENAQTWGDIELTADFNKDVVDGKLIKADKTATYTLDKGRIDHTNQYGVKDGMIFSGNVITEPVSYKANGTDQGKYAGRFLGKDAIEMVGKIRINEYDKYGKAQDAQYLLFGGSREPASNFPIAGEKTNYK